jgi:crotonobetainyl-CoA:carnitine CoA-transferase CaiB-like acyl-CoA transferase
VHRAAPVFGQHTQEVLREHGFSDAEINHMTAQGAIQTDASTKKGATR